MSVQFKLGCDPEVFCRRDGKPLAAFGLIEGNKKNPMPTDFGGAQVDGTALEFNTNPVSIHDFDAFNLNIVKALAFLRQTANVNLAIVPVQDFDPDYLAGLPDEAKELGCDPDYNAYTLEENPRPDGDRPFRTGAGHIHIGWGADIPTDNEEHVEICASFVKMMDATLGLYMTYLDREPRRRELYGKAGAFRPKPYGVEYRTPSNVWIKKKDYRYLAQFFTNMAVNKMSQGQTIEQVSGVSEERIQEIIDTGDAGEAYDVISRRYLSYTNGLAKKAWETTVNDWVKKDKELLATYEDDING